MYSTLNPVTLPARYITLEIASGFRISTADCQTATEFGAQHSKFRKLAKPNTVPVQYCTVVRAYSVKANADQLLALHLRVWRAFKCYNFCEWGHAWPQTSVVLWFSTIFPKFASPFDVHLPIQYTAPTLHRTMQYRKYCTGIHSCLKSWVLAMCLSECLLSVCRTSQSMLRQCVQSTSMIVKQWYCTVPVLHITGGSDWLDVPPCLHCQVGKYMSAYCMLLGDPVSIAVPCSASLIQTALYCTVHSATGTEDQSMKGGVQ